MKFKVTKASDWAFEEMVEINTLEELLDFIDQKEKEHYDNCDELSYFNGILIERDDFEHPHKKDSGWGIEIYDYYIE